MGKGSKGPKGGRPGGRMGGAGVGPGPGYKPNTYGGGKPHKGGGTGGGNKGGDCCPMVAAVRAAGRGRYRLARRYAAMSVRLLAARLA
jgi:hypothetical protein